MQEVMEVWIYDNGSENGKEWMDTWVILDELAKLCYILLCFHAYV